MTLDAAFTHFPSLTTNRLLLRQIQLNDAEALFPIFSDAEAMQFVINTITSPELWAYASRVKTGDDMRQRLNQGQASLHGLCTFLLVSEGRLSTPG